MHKLVYLMLVKSQKTLYAFMFPSVFPQKQPYQRFIDNHNDDYRHANSFLCHDQLFTKILHEIKINICAFN